RQLPTSRGTQILSAQRACSEVFVLFPVGFTPVHFSVCGIGLTSIAGHRSEDHGQCRDIPLRRRQGRQEGLYHLERDESRLKFFLIVPIWPYFLEQTLDAGDS